LNIAAWHAARSNKTETIGVATRGVARGDIMLTETVAMERTAASVAGESGLPCDKLANKIRVSVSKGDQYHITAGILLLEAKRRLPEFGLSWSAFLVGKCHLQKSRSSELIAIAEGRTSVAEVQAKGRERAARFAAKNKVARSSVSNGQSAHKEWLDRLAKKTVDADANDLVVIEQFVTARMSRRKSGALN
jgi:hypothetical protein